MRGTAFAASLAARPAESAPQPMMKKALASLRSAKKQLEAATPDKGGHRVKAIDLVNSAIDEVQAGIDYDNTHR